MSGQSNLLGGGGGYEGGDLLPELSGAELAMSLSPKHTTTPFSVTDILSPMDEGYRKELSPGYRPAAGHPHPPSSPSYIQFPGQYCNSDISYANTPPSWTYPPTPNDPRFASEYFRTFLVCYYFKFFDFLLRFDFSIFSDFYLFPTITRAVRTPAGNRFF